MLPEGGSHVDLRKEAPFFEYATQHGVEWYRFIRGPLGHRIQNGSLYLVTGCDKSPAWGVAAYSGPFGNNVTSLKFMAMGQRGDGTSLEYSWENYTSAAVRTGRQLVSSTEPGANPTFNQCAFIRGYRISVQSQLIPMLLGNRVKVEDGFNPLYEAKHGITSTLPFPTTDPAQSLVCPCWNQQHTVRKMTPTAVDEPEYDVSLEHIPNVSNVSLYLFRCS